MQKSTIVGVVVTVLFAAVPVRASDQTVADIGDASIIRDDSAGTWTIGNASIAAMFQPQPELRLVHLINRVTRFDWQSLPASDTFTNISGETRPLGARDGGYELLRVEATAEEGAAHLAFVFFNRDLSLRVSRHYMVWPGIAAVETWTRFETQSDADVPIADLNVWRLFVPGQQVEWINGLRGDMADRANDDAFSLQRRSLDAAARIDIGSEGRSSEREVPYFKIVSGSEALAGGLLWSGAWHLTLQASSGWTTATFGLAPMTTRVTRQRPVESPHGFLALSATVEDSSRVLRDYIQGALRGGRSFDTLVTYNTWFAYGTRVDEEVVRDEMERAAALGAELFVLDAGWYAGADVDDATDFSRGVGNWHADEGRFPSGLAALTTFAHDHGMKFGLWIEPERIALDILNQIDGVDEGWLAKADGRYDPSSDAPAAGQLCLASDAARAWLVGELERLIDDVQPDYLKWDNNFWINCTRSGHGHGATDGNFAHVAGLYEMLATLRQRYPALVVENVSGGGNRLDYGMLRYTDVAWMDDRTAPSIHVRHNLEGLGTALPPSYLFSFLIDHEGESLASGEDVPMYIRSRMAGVLGLTFRTPELPPDVAKAIADHINLYRSLRRTIQEGSVVLLTPQASIDNPPPWDAVQVIDAAGGQSVVFAFRTDPGATRTILLLHGLRPDATYDVQSVDAGQLGSATGTALMTDGVELVDAPASAAHVLIVSERSAP